MIRAKISVVPYTDATVNKSFLHVKLEWIEEETGQVLDMEEYNVEEVRAKNGCSFVSAVRFPSGENTGSYYWIDEKGLRHFVMRAEPGNFSMVGKELG